MLKQYKFIALLAVLCTGSLFAYPHPCPGSWTVKADYLYLFPTVDDTFFVVDVAAAGTPGNRNGTRQKNDFHFHSGFRVGGAYGLCDCDKDLQIYYTRLRTKQCKTVRGLFLSADSGDALLDATFSGYTGSASSSNHLLYQRVDAFVDQQILCLCGLNVYLQGGLEFAYLRFNESRRYQRTAGEGTAVGLRHHRTKTWGIGPQFGMETDYSLCQFSSCCMPGTLAIVASSSGSLLVSKTLRNADVSLADVLFDDINDKHTWRIIPALHARVGLNYATCFSCFGASVEVGYEFNTYLRALARVANPFTGSVTSVTSYNNFDIQGLYVNFDFTF